VFSSKRARFIAAGTAVVVIGGGAYGIVAATSGGSTTTTTASSSHGFGGHGFGGGSGPGGSGPGGGGSNARSGPAAGGAIGTVASMSASGFTLSTSAGQKVTVKEASTTTYETGTSTASASAVTSGEPVLVLGTTDSATITAAQVIVRPPSSGGSSPGGQVIASTKGKQGSSQQVGQIPSDYTQGSGTLVSGTTADKAVEAALAAYPGGIVDRVVALGNGDYEVHNIGVNWPHHIFVNADFKVIGANS
jgi:membrane-bound inhibitor of C-type lysozyme